MRKIEQEMLSAIRNNAVCWRKANMAVEWLDDEEAGKRFPMTHAIYLHGNHIADAWADCTGKIYAAPNMDTLRDWPTVTTLSRLRALGIDVYRANNWVHLGRDTVCEAR